MDDDEQRQPQDRGDDQNNSWRSLLALVFVLALAGLAVFVVNALRKQVAIQNCVLSGRRDCIEMTIPDDAASRPANP